MISTKEYIKIIFIIIPISAMAFFLAKLPVFSTIGMLVLALLLGMVYRYVKTLSTESIQTVSKLTKIFLQVGIVFLGVRINLFDIYDAGKLLFLLATIYVIISLVFVYGLARIFQINKTLSLLTACGTAICGAAAVMAVAPQIKAKHEDIAISAATVALVGTFFSVIYTVLYSLFPIPSSLFAVFSGITLHEVAHVLAAAAPAGLEASDIAIVTKLTRVLFLIPVTFIIAFFYFRSKKTTIANSTFYWKPPFPWFIFGFLFMSILHTVGVLPSVLIPIFTTLSSLFIAFAMAGLGLSIQSKTVIHSGKQIMLVALISSTLLCVGSFIFLFFFHANFSCVLYYF
ncbi:YeiH family protein [Alkalihalobacterium bogoriense]|uniref:YeiH family protein n=1 Tax=Alkalihalobacterium bogoriense TaxID=246272 RepID=UPI000688DA18|nr:putative sulfate exporter family transporter [Alkalihalobacterium bogoriense]